MAVSKASKGQRRRRRREINNKKIAPAKTPKNKSNPPQLQTPKAIVVISDSEDNKSINVLIGLTKMKKSHATFKHQPVTT